MSFQKKCYRNGKPRGGVEGVCVDTSFGAKGNNHASKKNYPKVSLEKDKKKEGK